MYARTREGDAAFRPYGGPFAPLAQSSLYRVLAPVDPLITFSIVGDTTRSHRVGWYYPPVQTKRKSQSPKPSETTH